MISPWVDKIVIEMLRNPVFQRAREDSGETARVNHKEAFELFDILPPQERGNTETSRFLRLVSVCFLDVSLFSLILNWLRVLSLRKAWMHRGTHPLTARGAWWVRHSLEQKCTMSHCDHHASKPHFWAMMKRSDHTPGTVPSCILPMLSQASIQCSVVKSLSRYVSHPFA
jgi:hypothetical protein